MITALDYAEILSYCKKRISFKNLNSKIDYIDVAHNVIASDAFDLKQIYYLVDKYIYEELNFTKKHLFYEEIKEVQTKSTPEPLLRCKICDNDFPYSYYECVKYICCKCYRHENRNRINANSRRSYFKNREKNKEKDREKCRQYRKNNKEKVSKYNKDYKLQNKDKIKEYNKRYQEENKEKIRAQRKEYRERKKKNQ